MRLLQTLHTTGAACGAGPSPPRSALTYPSPLFRWSHMHRTTLVRLALPLLLAGVASASHAATYTVDRTTDPGNGATRCTALMCSLRGAVSSANASAGPDHIVLAAGVYTLSLTGAGEDANLTGDLDILDELSIEGARSANTTIRWATADVDRLLQFHPSQPDHRLSLGALTLRNGDSGAEPGGAILSNGAIALRSVVLIDNSTAAYGAGIAMQSVPAGTLPSVDFSTVRFENNVAALNTGGGALDLSTSCGDVRIGNATFVDNSGGHGGGIWLGGCVQTPSQVQIHDSSFTGNSAYSGAGIRIQPGNVVAIVDSIFDANINYGSIGTLPGGAITNTGAVLDIVGTSFLGNRAFDLGGATLGKGGAIGGTAPRLIEDSLFDGNRAGEEGGALHLTDRVEPFVIRRSRFIGNSTDAFGGDARAAGGAIFIDYGAQALAGGADSIVASHFEANLAPGPDANDGGGAIHTRGATPLHVESSSFVANTGGPGGAIHAHDCNDSAQQPSLAVRNSTFSGNTTSGSVKRGGAIAATGCAVTLDAVTIAANGADQGTALYAVTGAGPASFSLRNTLLAGTCQDASGTAIDDDGGNIESPGDSCQLVAATSQPLIPSGLLLLGNLVEGITSYYRPSIDSAVIDAGLGGADCPDTDQRGIGRIDARCDVGSVESSNPLLFRDGFEGSTD